MSELGCSGFELESGLGGMGLKSHHNALFPVIVFPIGFSRSSTPRTHSQTASPCPRDQIAGDAGCVESSDWSPGEGEWWICMEGAELDIF